MSRIVAFYSMVVVLSACPAFAVTDQATGLAIEPPAPFTATLVDRLPANTAAMINVTLPGSTAGGFVGDNDECAITFRLLPQNAPYTQQQINATAVSPEMKNLTKASLQLGFDVGDAVEFDIAGAAGLEFVGKMKAGPRAGVPTYIATVQTPKGATLLMCFSSSARFEGLVPQFRAVRDAIKPPR